MIEDDQTHYVGDDCPGGHRHVGDAVPMPAPHEVEQGGFWEYDPGGRSKGQRWVSLAKGDER